MEQGMSSPGTHRGKKPTKFYLKTLALHREHTLSDMFVAYLLGRNIRYEGHVQARTRSSTSAKHALGVIDMTIDYALQGL